MTTSGEQPKQMAEIAGLAASLAERIIEKHKAGTTIPPELFRMLVQAARILLDNGVPWPPAVEFLIMEVGRRVAAAVADDGEDPTRSFQASYKD